MQPARFRQEDFLLVEINNAKSTSPAVSSGEERGLLSRTAAGNRAYDSGQLESFAPLATTHFPLRIGNFVLYHLQQRARTIARISNHDGDAKDDAWSKMNLNFTRKICNCLDPFSTRIV